MNHESANHPLSASIGKLTSRPLALAISSLLLSGALAGTVEAQVFPAVVKLTELDGSSGFRLDGLAEYDYSGLSVSGAGDINGDVDSGSDTEDPSQADYLEVTFEVNLW